MLDRQKIVNFVSAKFKEQGCKAYDNSRCKYRYGELKCAIGHLILDEEYQKSFEGKYINYIMEHCPISFEKFGSIEEFDEEYYFLDILQKCHDDADNDNFYESFLVNLKVYLDMQPETV
jgi:hypothetical protein